MSICNDMSIQYISGAEMNRRRKKREEVNDVYCYLLHTGDLYAERRRLLHQKKILEELKHLNVHSVLSPFASQNEKQQKERAPGLLEWGSLPVSERLYHLHRKNLQGAVEGSAQIEKKYSLKEREATVERRCAPSLHPEEAKLLTHSCRSNMPLLQVVEKVTQMDNERNIQSKNQSVCVQEDEMKCVSEKSFLCASTEDYLDNPSLGYLSVEERVPEKEKKEEKICRQMWVQRHSDSEESCLRRSSPESSSLSLSTSLKCHTRVEKEVRSPLLTHHRRNSDFFVRAGDVRGVPSPLKKTSLYSLKEKELNVVLRDEETVRDAHYKEKSNEYSCQPARRHSSHYSVKQAVSPTSECEGEISQMRMTENVHLDPENCLSVLSFCTAEKWPAWGIDEVGQRTGKTIEKTMHNEKAVKKESPSYDFSPTLCPTSRRIVAQRRQLESTRGKVMRSPSTRLHAAAAARQRLSSSLSFSKGRKQKTPPNSSSKVSSREALRTIGKERDHHSMLSFSLQVPLESKKLWRRRVEEVQRRNSNRSNANEAREKLWREAALRKEEELQCKREESERLLLQECTFQPSLNRYRSLLQLDDEECAPDPNVSLSVAERNVLWAANKAKELEEKRTLRENAELQECTFRPNAHLHKARK